MERLKLALGAGPERGRGALPLGRRSEGKAKPPEAERAPTDENTILHYIAYISRTKFTSVNL
jgi:hypothetical protein